MRLVSSNTSFGYWTPHLQKESKENSIFVFGKKGDLCRLSIFDSNAVSKLLLANIPPSPLFPLFPVLTKNDYVMNVTVTHQDSATSVLAIEIQRARSYRNLHDNMLSIYKTI